MALSFPVKLNTNIFTRKMCNLSTYLLNGEVLIFSWGRSSPCQLSCSVKGGISMRIHPFPARPRLLAVVISTAAMLLLLFVPLAAYAHANTAPGLYQQTNLVSDLPNIATFQDPNLLNPWGLSHGPTPWWVSDNGAGVATLYNGGGQAFPLPPSSPLV